MFSLNYSAGDKLGQSSGITTFSVLVLCGPKGSGRGEDGLSWGVSIGQSQGSDGLSMASSRFELPRKYNYPIRSIGCGLKPGSGQPFKADEWYTLAATWLRTGDKYALCLYMDGKCLAKTTMPVSPLLGTANPDPKDLLLFGSPLPMRGSLECLRLSKKARTPEEIAAAEKAGLVKDSETLIFIDAGTVAKMKDKPVEDLINKEGKTLRVPPEGRRFGEVEFAQGRKGKVIKFPR